ncbi:hypothetical protein BOTNAR_0543g00010 [Botryotinia narcissicola]|uniref:Uncharacterized protein n=1 Tax=Botryotinia narcissicola TaxID=278944 RepID=A0A4Z1HEB6_9HELO|nr:hypothetical protein BOTNAR_0543g00010 [Botryotinia narcissicola]
MNAFEEAQFLLSLTKKNSTMAWPSLQVKRELDEKNRLFDEAQRLKSQLFAEAERLQKRIRIEPEQLARQRLRMANIRARRQRGNKSKKELIADNSTTGTKPSTQTKSASNFQQYGEKVNFEKNASVSGDLLDQHQHRKNVSILR